LDDERDYLVRELAVIWSQGLCSVQGDAMRWKR
jgi:hypothetical protein